MLITKEIEWDMGHRVPNHKSQCRNPHGHRYRMQVTLSGDVISEGGSSDEGMVIDFSDIKTISKEFVDEILDHGFMYYEGDKVMKQFFQMWQLMKDPWDLTKGLKNRRDGFKYIEVDFIPTAENIAKWIFDRLSSKFKDTYGTGLKLYSIKLWETPTSSVMYCPDMEEDKTTFKK